MVAMTTGEETGMVLVSSGGSQDSLRLSQCTGMLVALQEWCWNGAGQFWGLSGQSEALTVHRDVGCSAGMVLVSSGGSQDSLRLSQCTGMLVALQEWCWNGAGQFWGLSGQSEALTVHRDVGCSAGMVLVSSGGSQDSLRLSQCTGMLVALQEWCWNGAGQFWGLSGQSEALTVHRDVGCSAGMVLVSSGGSQDSLRLSQCTGMLVALQEWCWNGAGQFWGLSGQSEALTVHRDVGCSAGMVLVSSGGSQDSLRLSQCTGMLVALQEWCWNGAGQFWGLSGQSEALTVHRDVGCSAGMVLVSSGGSQDSLRLSQCTGMLVALQEWCWNGAGQFWGLSGQSEALTVHRDVGGEYFASENMK
ncbi:UNVERIFIED_CONTAM: hypothetical protein FKN15_035806 [Acipenser sinensis]